MAACLVAVGFPLMAGDFAPPAEGPVAFRRDQIPIDADAMSALSKQIEFLARALNPQTPADHRAAAQMIALAMALDPANSSARTLISEYEEQHHKPNPDADRLEKARARIWQYIAWLETPEAGNQGHALAACLKDVIVASDPNHPKAAALRDGGEKGAWAGWIPPLSAYEPKVIAKTDEPTEPVPAQEPTVETPLRLESATVQTLLWRRGLKETDPWVLARAPLNMSASMIPDGKEGADRFSLTIGGDAANGPGGGVIRAALKTIHGNLPPGLAIQITSKELEKSLGSGKRQPISAAAAVLANSALSGSVPEAIVLGQIDETGAFRISSSFWDQLLALGKGTGQRLVLPMDSAPYLSSVLALEKPEFFLEYEVLLAPDFKQLLDLTAKEPQGTLAAGIAKFKEVRERAGTQDVRLYIANTFVKQRLMAVMQDIPLHASARLLLLQASGNRPLLVARPVLAAEIRRALEPMAWLMNPEFSPDESYANKIGQTYDACRSRVEALERYTDKNDHVLLEHARAVVIAIRNIDRAARSRGESYFGTETMLPAIKEFRRLAKDLRDELSAETGDGTPLPGH